MLVDEQPRDVDARQDVVDGADSNRQRGDFVVAQRNPSLDLGAYLVHGPRRAVDQQVLLEEGRIVLDGQAHHVDDVGQGVEGLRAGRQAQRRERAVHVRGDAIAKRAGHR